MTLQEGCKRHNHGTSHVDHTHRDLGCADQTYGPAATQTGHRPRSPTTPTCNTTGADMSGTSSWGPAGSRMHTSGEGTHSAAPRWTMRTWRRQCGGRCTRLSTRGSSQRALYLCCLAGGTTQHTAYLKWLAAEPEYCFKIAGIKNTCLPQVLHTSGQASCT